MTKAKAKHVSDSKMDSKLKAEWITALRSGKYKQIKGALEDTNEDGKIIGNCCLGVLCRVAYIKGTIQKGQNTIFGKEAKGSLSGFMLKKTGLGGGDESTLIDLNDGTAFIKQKSFKQIATWIEKNIGTTIMVTKPVAKKPKSVVKPLPKKVKAKTLVKKAKVISKKKPAK